MLASCTSFKPEKPITAWRYEDLLALDPLDSAQRSQDLIALSLRYLGAEFQVRLDFFDLERFPDYDLTILIDSEPGGATDLPLAGATTLQWDYLLRIPAEGPSAFLDTDLQPIPAVSPRVIRDPDMDTVSIYIIPRDLILDLDSLTLEVYLTPRDSDTIADKLGPARPSDPLPGQAPVLLAFWNVYPAYSPAQALRRWDGAHTGPFGERHGLRHLVQGAARFSVPVWLLDLKNGPSLSALDYLNILHEFSTAGVSQMLQVPDAVYLPAAAVNGELPFRPPPFVIDQMVAHSRGLGETFGLPTSQALYAPLPPGRPQPRHRLIFQPPAADTDSRVFETSVTRYLDSYLIQLPGLASSQDLQTTAEGLTLATRQRLIERALRAHASDPSEILVLGGEFTSSAWGDPQASRAGLRYLGTHPWIRVLDEGDLLAVEPALSGRVQEPSPVPEIPLFTTAGLPIPGEPSAAQMHTQLLERLEETPAGQIKNLAWETYYALLAPNPPAQPGSPALRAGYLGQIGGLLAAARWAERPGALNDCESDPDLDGQPECLLANDKLFLLIEPDGARISLGFVMTPAGPRQWIAPQSQFIVGFGDPLAWDPARGPAGDPGDLPGAFTDEVDRWAGYRARSLDGRQIFEQAGTGRIKTYRLAENEVTVTYREVSDWPGEVKIPLAISPAARFIPGWGATYHLLLGGEALTWAWDGGVTASISPSVPVRFTAFNQSRDFLKMPEDPNFDYPPGHYLPFPLAVVALTPTENFTLTLQVDTGS